MVLYFYHGFPGGLSGGGGGDVHQGHRWWWWGLWLKGWRRRKEVGGRRVGLVDESSGFGHSVLTGEGGGGLDLCQYLTNNDFIHHRVIRP